MVEVVTVKKRSKKFAGFSTREERRDRTIRYGERARKLHLRRIHPDGVVDCVCEFSVWKFAKGKSLGCGCRRRGRGCSPKVTASLCHRGAGGYHPSVRLRIDGRRLARAWLADAQASRDAQAFRADDLLDVEL